MLTLLLIELVGHHPGLVSESACSRVSTFEREAETSYLRRTHF